MGSTRRGMVDVLLEGGGPDATPDGLSTGASVSGPLDPPDERRLTWLRLSRRWWPVAAVLVIVLLTTSVVADGRERHRIAALADVPGVLAPLGASVTQKWYADEGQYQVVGSTADLVIAELDRADGRGAVVGLAMTSGDIAWEAALWPDGAANFGAQCAAPSSRPATVVVCVVVDEIEEVMVGTVVGASFPSKARLLVLDASDGTVLADGPTDPSSTPFFAESDLVIGQVRSDGRFQVSRQSTWDAPPRWTFTTPEPLGVDEFGHRAAWATAAGDLVQVESWSMSTSGGARLSWVLAGDGSVLRSPRVSDAAGYGDGYGTLRRGRLLTEPGGASGSGYTTLFDLATNSQFRVDAHPFDAVPDDGSLDDLLLAQSPSGHDLIAISIASGRPLWTVPSPSTSGAMVIEGRIIRVETDRLVSIDGRTGETLWSMPLDEASVAAARYQPMATSLFTDGRVVLFAGADPSRSLEVTAYGLADGRELWSSTLPRGTWLSELDGKLIGWFEQTLLGLG
ncbi:PQQ-binding-like beta-propeller repeat protein [Pengzhenrongella phosphoraccumulans]|uniref:outer membrane protein assembly factor BamB family protein n=1 Tax=Pengzhenrongella phosphoraccumulans TaxID=3114394 RepID=UPI00388FD445